MIAAVRALRLACVLLAVSTAAAANVGPCVTVSTAVAMANTDTCTCPTGTGTGSSSLSDPASGAVTSANDALLLCDDLLPGYYIVAATVASNVAPVPCAAASYCVGLTNAYATGSFKLSCTAGGTAGIACTTATNAGVTYAEDTTNADGSDGTKGGLTACTAGFGIGGVTAITAATGCNSIAPGYYIAASAGVPSAPSNCPTGSYCPGIANAALTNNVAIATANTISGTPTSATVAQGATACPTGTTIASSTSNVDMSFCDDLKAGYYLTTALTYASNGGVAGLTPTAMSTLLTTAIQPCSTNKYCLGNAGNTLLGLTFVSGGNIALPSGSVAVPSTTALGNPGPCPTGTGNALTGATAQGANAVSAATACVDLLPGYSLTVGNTVTVVATLVAPCAAGTYKCGGLAGLFVAVAPISGTGITAIASGTSMAMTAATTPALPQGVTTVAPGSLIAALCPAGSTNTAATGATIASCLVQPGYYVDHSDLNCATLVGGGPATTCATCPAGEYCPGGIVSVGTAGGDTVCPTGSVGPTLSSILNSNIADCVLSAGYYTTSAAPNVPAACPSGFICAGGAALGTIGGVGSTSCTGSSNPACLAPAGPANTTTTVNGAPVTVSPAAVTVSPAAVTVTPAAQPITINFTHSPVFASAAPRAAAHAAVLALAALAALVAF